LDDEVITSSQVPSDIEPESEHEINNQWRSQCDKGKVHKVEPDSRAGYTHFLAYIATHSEGVSLNIISDCVYHNINIRRVPLKFK